jgi:hypothetical protein
MKSDYQRTGRLYPKIDLAYWVDAERYWHYAGSTEQWRTCRDAKASYCAMFNVPADKVRARKAIGRSYRNPNG